MSTVFRGVSIPESWICEGNSLLVWKSPNFKPIPSRDGVFRIAGFDFDGTLADTNPFGGAPHEWKHLVPEGPAAMKQLHEAGYTVVVMSNESMDRFKNESPKIHEGLVRKTGRMVGWAQSVGEWPFIVLMALYD